MDVMTISTFFAWGFGLGMVHAFDPDHIAAVSGVQASFRETKGSSARPFSGSQCVWQFSLRWALGHGMAILAMAAAVFVLGLAIPKGMSDFAERSISFLLIVLGSIALVKLFWLGARANSMVNHQRSAWLLGLIHGIAGSAPLLALIPLTKVGHPMVAFVYVLLFSAGVLLAMTGLGSVLTLSIRWTSRFSYHYEAIFRALFALFTLLVGVFLLF